MQILVVSSAIPLGFCVAGMKFINKFLLFKQILMSGPWDFNSEQNRQNLSSHGARVLDLDDNSFTVINSYSR